MSELNLNKGMTKSQKHEAKWAYIFIAPIVVGTLIFSIYPIIYSFYMSLTDWTGLSAASFVGLQNFIDLFRTEKFYLELRNTVVYAIVTVPVALILSIITANLLNCGLKSTGIFRVIYFLPNIMMPVAVAMVWKILLNSKFGLVNIALSAIGIKGPSWISDPNYILISLMIISVWSSVGYNTVILLAGLQSIQPALYEAAELDGAGVWGKFVHLTLPLLTPSIFFLLTMNTMNALRVFDVIYIFNGAGLNNNAGPLLNASRSVVFGIIEKAFSNYKMGAASAEALVLFVIIMIITGIQMKLQKKWVFYS